MRANTRRNFLRTGALAAAGLATTAVGTAQAAPEHRQAPTYVLVPGSHGSAQSMSTLTNELTARGHRALAVDLPGHGTEADFPSWYPQDLATMATAPSSIASVTLADATKRVADVVRRVARNGPVVLVGHSLGGAVIGTVGNTVPHLVNRIVYLAGFCPVTLPTVAEYSVAPENAGSLLRDPSLIAAPLTIGALRVNWCSADPVFLGKLTAAYLADGTPARLRAIIAGLQPDETLRFSVDNAQVHADTWGRIPRHYVKLTQDRAMPIPLQDRMIREADQLTPHNRFQVRELAMSHLGVITRPAQVVDLLLSLDRAAGTPSRESTAATGRS